MPKKHNKHNPQQQRPQQAATQRPPAPPVTPTRSAAPAPFKTDEPRPCHEASTREQRLLCGVHAALTPARARLDLLSRAQSLPMMIQRHGPAQTLMFLESKDAAEDKALAEIFREALTRAEPILAKRLPSKNGRDLEAYLRLDLTHRLHLTLCCVELANLLMRRLKVDELQKKDAARDADGGAA